MNKTLTQTPDNFNHGNLSWRYRCIDCKSHSLYKNFGKESDKRYYCHGCNETKMQVFDKKNECKAKP